MADSRKSNSGSQAGKSPANSKSPHPASASKSPHSAAKFPHPAAKSPHGASSSKAAAAAAAASASSSRPDIILSQTKIRAIMKSSPEVDHVGNDALYLITKATELFIQHVASRSIEGNKGSKTLDYKNLADLVERDENLDFLKEIIPQKMTARMALQEVAKQKALLNKELFS